MQVNETTQPGTKQGETAPLATLYDQNGARIYAFILAIVGDVSDAEEITQDVFLRLHATGRQPENPCAYLFKAARNAAYSRLRWRWLRFRKQTSLCEHTALLQANDNGHGKLEREHIEAALKALPSRQREVVVLKIYDDMTFPQIAEVMGGSANTAASRYRYALQKLRERLSEEES